MIGVAVKNQVAMNPRDILVKGESKGSTSYVAKWARGTQLGSTWAPPTPVWAPSSTARWRSSPMTLIDSLFEGIDFYTSITRARFEELCSDLFKGTLD